MQFTIEEDASMLLTILCQLFLTILCQLTDTAWLVVEVKFSLIIIVSFTCTKTYENGGVLTFS